MLPHIFRMQGEEYLEQNRERLFAAGFDGILARNPEEIVWLRERGNALPTGLDACVYAWNSAAVAALRETDARFFTLPLAGDGAGSQGRPEAWISGGACGVWILSHDGDCSVSVRDSRGMFPYIQDHKAA